jgi:hypothetical protein
MRNLFFTCILSSIYISCFAQEMPILGGLYFNSGLSTILGPKETGPGGTSMDYGYLPAIGGGGVFNAGLSEKVSLFFSLGYMQRGSSFATNLSGTPPRYNLHYLDFSLGSKYFTGLSMGKKRWIVSGGITYHSLLNANRERRIGATEHPTILRDDIKEDIKPFDIGLLLGSGIESDLWKGIIQAQIFVNAGVFNVYDGVLSSNKMMGRNLVFGIQLAYLYNFRKEGSGSQ